MNRGTFPRTHLFVVRLVFGLVFGFTGFWHLISGELQGASHSGLVEQAQQQVQTVYPLIGFTWPEGSYLHIEGQLTGSEAVDYEFGFTIPGMYLRRNAEVCVKNRSAGRPRGSKLQWVADPLYSAGFAARDATLEHVPVDASVLAALGEGEIVYVPHGTGRWPEGFPATGYVEIPDGYYIGANPDWPEQGDRRLRWTRIAPGRVSVVAQYSDGRLTSWSDSSGERLALAMTGSHSSRDLLDRARHARDGVLWINRIGASLFIGAAVGFIIFFRPR